MYSMEQTDKLEEINADSDFDHLVELVTAWGIDSIDFESNIALSLHIEFLKLKLGLDMYLSTIVLYCDYCCTEDIEVLAKRLSPSIVDAITCEAKELKMFKDTDPVVTLFD